MNDIRIISPQRGKHLIFFHLYGTLFQLEGIGPPFVEPKLAFFVVLTVEMLEAGNSVFCCVLPKKKNMPFLLGGRKGINTKVSQIGVEPGFNFIFELKHDVFGEKFVDLLVA